jgi:hypothetical protein
LFFTGICWNTKNQGAEATKEMEILTPTELVLDTTAGMMTNATTSLDSTRHEGHRTTISTPTPANGKKPEFGAQPNFKKNEVDSVMVELKETQDIRTETGTVKNAPSLRPVKSPLTDEQIGAIDLPKQQNALKIDVESRVVSMSSTSDGTVSPNSLLLSMKQLRRFNSRSIETEKSCNGANALITAVDQSIDSDSGSNTPLHNVESTKSPSRHLSKQEKRKLKKQKARRDTFELHNMQVPAQELKNEGQEDDGASASQEPINAKPLDANVDKNLTFDHVDSETSNPSGHMPHSTQAAAVVTDRIDDNTRTDTRVIGESSNEGRRLSYAAAAELPAAISVLLQKQQELADRRRMIESLLEAKVNERRRDSMNELMCSIGLSAVQSPLNGSSMAFKAVEPTTVVVDSQATLSDDLMASTGDSNEEEFDDDGTEVCDEEEEMEETLFEDSEDDDAEDDVFDDEVENDELTDDQLESDELEDSDSNNPSDSPSDNESDNQPDESDSEIQSYCDEDEADECGQGNEGGSTLDAELEHARSELATSMSPVRNCLVAMKENAMNDARFYLSAAAMPFIPAEVHADAHLLSRLGRLGLTHEDVCHMIMMSDRDLAAELIDILQQRVDDESQMD